MADHIDALADILDQMFGQRVDLLVRHLPGVHQEGRAVAAFIVSRVDEQLVSGWSRSAPPCAQRGKCSKHQVDFVLGDQLAGLVDGGLRVRFVVLDD